MQRMKHIHCWITAPLLLVFCSGFAVAQTQPVGITLKVGGFIKFDAISSGYQDGDLAAGSIGRDYFVPGSIPIGGENESRDIDFHAKSSRINFETSTQIADQKVVSFIEIDFMTTDGDERVTNGYQPQLRHAYFTFDKWVFGQTWSTFQNPAALPESLDYIGPSEGTVFVRQAQVRYTSGPWQVSLENPETTFTPYQTVGREITDDATVPDWVGRYNLTGDWGGVSVAALLRDLNYENIATDVDDHATGYGVSVSGKIMLGSRDDLRFMINGGSGLGRYIAINTANDAVLDANVSGELEVVDAFAGFISYRHVWTDKWRSSLFVSMFEADYDPDLVGGAVTKKVQSVHANLLYSPVPKVTLGGEVMYAKREQENSVDGTLNRLQLSAKYEF